MPGGWRPAAVSFGSATEFPLVTTGGSAAARPRLTPGAFSPTGFSLTLSGTPSQNYAILASTNLVT